MVNWTRLTINTCEEIERIGKTAKHLEFLMWSIEYWLDNGVIPWDMLGDAQACVEFIINTLHEIAKKVVTSPEERKSVDREFAYYRRLLFDAHDSIKRSIEAEDPAIAKAGISRYRSFLFGFVKPLLEEFRAKLKEESKNILAKTTLRMLGAIPIKKKKLKEEEEWIIE